MSAGFGDIRLPDRFWSKVEPEPMSGCWLWNAATFSNGYGHIGNRKKNLLAHRVAYLALVGAIPEGLEIDHLCRVRCCVNPSHLEPVIHRTNILRGSGPSAENAAKTACQFGHAYHVRSSGKRGCRRCDAEKKMARYWRDPEYRAIVIARVKARADRLSAAVRAMIPVP